MSLNAANNATNAQAFVASGDATPLTGDLHSFISTMLSFSALGDWLKLLVVGGVLETCRRYLSSGWEAIVSMFWLTATFDAHDDTYRWVLFWLSHHSAWTKTRTFEVAIRTFGLENHSDDDTDENNSRQITYLPAMESTNSLWYKGYYMTVAREEKTESQWSTKERLQIRILSRNHSVMQSLLDEARVAYKAAREKCISIYAADTSGDWTFMTSRPKRPLSSIVLDPGIKELLFNDAHEFLRSRKWYTNRGIPYRRGYLLYGAPGSGKTSMIQSIAGELGLDVYIATLSRFGMDDASLNELMSNMPRRCILLMEDIDAAFTVGIKRDLPPEGNPRQDREDSSRGADGKAHPAEGTDASSGSRVTLSGLLNALDGIGAQEGRILFATTNNYRALDPALCRPGRMDIHVEFKLASRCQAESLYKCFFLPDDAGVTDAAEKADEGYDSRCGSGDEDEPDRETKGADASEETPLLAASPSPRPSTALPSSPLCSSPDTPLSARHLLSRSEVLELAARFADAIPEREYSMASLQGYLMMYKGRPREAVDSASQWVEKERALK